MSKRIVLVDPSGALLLEGYSMLDGGTPPSDVDEPVPETKRSAVHDE